MTYFNKNTLLYILGIVVVILLLRNCEGDVETVTKTKIEYVNVTDTITKTVIEKVEKPVYINKYKTVKGKDSIVYVTTPNDSTIKANQFKTTINSNRASADLTILSTGEVLDVQGVINFTQENTTTETIKKTNKSGFFVYGKSIIKNIQPEVGVLYQFKNKAFVSGGVKYNDFTKSIDYTIGIGIKIF